LYSCICWYLHFHFHNLHSNASYDTSDEDFELNEGFSDKREEMLLSNISQLEADVADLSRQLGQIDNMEFISAAENEL